MERLPNPIARNNPFNRRSNSFLSLNLWKKFQKFSKGKQPRVKSKIEIIKIWQEGTRREREFSSLPLNKLREREVALFDLRPWKIVSLFVNENVYTRQTLYPMVPTVSSWETRQHVIRVTRTERVTGHLRVISSGWKAEKHEGQGRKARNRRTVPFTLSPTSAPSPDPL